MSIQLQHQCVLAEEIETEINLPIEAYIPNFYIPDEQEKISVYQKLAGSYSEEILKEFEEDLEEEFGTPPKQVGGLFRILRLKMVCRKAGVMRIKMEGGKVGSQEVVVTLHPRVTAKHIVPLLAKNDKWKVVGSSLRIKKDDLGESWFAALKKDMEVLVGKKQKLDK